MHEETRGKTSALSQPGGRDDEEYGPTDGGVSDGERADPETEGGLCWVSCSDPGYPTGRQPPVLFPSSHLSDILHISLQFLSDPDDKSITLINIESSLDPSCAIQLQISK